jgi:hypothetical protein
MDMNAEPGGKLLQLGHLFRFELDGEKDFLLGTHGLPRIGNLINPASMISSLSRCEIKNPPLNKRRAGLYAFCCCC